MWNKETFPGRTEGSGWSPASEAMSRREAGGIRQRMSTRFRDTLQRLTGPKGVRQVFRLVELRLHLRTRESMSCLV